MTDHGPDEPDSPVLTAPQGMKLWSVIVTILGDLLPEGDADVSGLVLSALIERMGLQPQAMRVALHRLKRDGWIESRKDGRVGYYRLSDMGRAQAAEVSEAIYGGAVPSRARPMLAISPSAWREACEVMGEQHAAIALAAIYQRTDQISSAGGYLRSLTEKAREGKFSTWPMVMALLRAKLDAQKSPGKVPERPWDDGEGNEGGGTGLRVSDSLLKTLQNPRFR